MGGTKELLIDPSNHHSTHMIMENGEGPTDHSSMVVFSLCCIQWKGCQLLFKHIVLKEGYNGEGKTNPF
jgi:hypothetical protein